MQWKKRCCVYNFVQCMYFCDSEYVFSESIAELTLMWMYVTLYSILIWRCQNCNWQNVLYHAILRYFSKSRSWRHFYRPRSKIIMSHTPSSCCSCLTLLYNSYCHDLKEKNITDFRSRKPILVLCSPSGTKKLLINKKKCGILSSLVHDCHLAVNGRHSRLVIKYRSSDQLILRHCCGLNYVPF